MPTTFTTTNYTAMDPTRANTSRFADANVSSGSVEFAVIPYTLSGTEATNDLINLTILPAGAIPVPQLSSITCSADPGTTLKFNIGTAASATGWANTVDVSAGGEVEITAGTMPAWLAPTPIVADTGSGNAVVYATVQTASALTASVIVYFTLAYKRGR